MSSLLSSEDRKRLAQLYFSDLRSAAAPRAPLAVCLEAQRPVEPFASAPGIPRARGELQADLRGLTFLSVPNIRTAQAVFRNLNRAKNWKNQKIHGKKRSENL